MTDGSPNISYENKKYKHQKILIFMPYNGIQSIGILLSVYAVLNFNYAFFFLKNSNA